MPNKGWELEEDPLEEAKQVAASASIRQNALITVRNTATTQPLSLGERDLLLGLIDVEPGFIGRYVGHFAPITQVPVEFHIAIALAAISGAVGNRVFYDAYQRQYHPNIYVLLLAGSGVFRKTYSIGLMRDIMDKVLPDVIQPSSFSVESLEDILADRPDSLFIYSEFSEFLQRGKRDYQKGVKEAFTDLFDNPAERKFRFRGRGKGAIKHGAPIILGATTLPWLEKNIDESDIKGGFLPRFLIFTGTDRGPYVPSKVANYPGTTHLEGDLEEIGKAKGEVDFSAVRLLADNIVQRYETEIAGSGADPTLSGWYARIGTYLFKLSTLYMLSRTLGQKMTVIDEDVYRAAATLRYCHSQIENLPLAFTPQGQRLRSIENIIMAHPAGIKRGDILRGVRDLTLQEFQYFVRTLLAKGYRETVTKAGGHDQFIYRPPQ
jgi:hypothetical protein